jgi:hypothetical protein
MAPVNRTQRFFGNWGNSMTNALYGGMDLGTRLNQFGTSQRLAPNIERNARQGLDNNFLNGGNQTLLALNDRRVAQCTLLGWSTPECQGLLETINREKAQRPSAPVAQPRRQAFPSNAWGDPIADLGMATYQSPLDDNPGVY